MSYPAWGTSPIKCAKRKCGWIGTEKDLQQIPHAKFKNVTQSACPKCGCTGYHFVKEGK